MRNPIERSAQLRPVAQPVDTFVTPQRSPLRDVADALGGFNRNLQDYMEAKRTKEAENEKIRGKAYGLTRTPEELKAEAEGVRSGRIPGQMSQNFMEGAYQSQGELAGGQLQQKWDAAFQAWPGKDTEDPKAYDEFVQGFLKENFDPNSNAAFLRGSLPAVNQLLNNGRAQYIAYRNDAVQRQSLNSHVGAAIQFLRQSDLDGLSSGKGTDYAKNDETIALKRQEFVASGGKGDDFDKAMMEGISALALETQDPKLLDWFSKPGADGVRPDALPDGLRIKNATMSQLRSMAGEQATAQAAREERERKKALNEARMGVMNSLLTNPNGTIPEDLLKAAERNGDWDIRTKINQYRKDLSEGVSDPTKLQALSAEIVSSPNVDPMSLVRRALDAGVFKSDEDLRKAVTFAQSFKDNADKIGSVSQRQSYQQAIRVIQDRTTLLNDLGNPVSGLSDSALAASYDFRQLMARWMIDNPQATDQEIEKRINEVQTSILGNIKVNEDNLGDKPAGDYTRDPNLEFPNAANSRVIPQGAEDPVLPGDEPATPPATEQQPKGNGAGPTKEQIDKYIQQMPADKKALIENTLKQKGSLDLKGYTRNLLTANPNLRPISYNPADEDVGQGDTRGRSFSPEQAEGWITQARSGADQMQGDSRATTEQNLLSLIGQAEAGGNYNAVFGAAQSDIDLSQFTVDDILARQQWARQNGYDSTAIGKYQILYGTLAGLKAEGVVDGTESFDKVTQDKLGKALLNRRGMQEYLNGSISSRAFALRLSQEWAALPNPSTGKSYYAGDGLNASRVPASKVYAAMGLRPQPISYGNEGGDIGILSFDHPEQAAGVTRELKGIIAGAYQDIGLNSARITSGFRDHDHPAEAGKKSGGGEHTKGTASDVNMSGLSEAQRGQLVQSLIARGAKRFITYDKYPDMLHVDLKDQNGDGSPYFMHNKSAKNIAKAPEWFRRLALGDTI